MRIIQLAAEFAPLAKAGGLGEVVFGLSKELSRLSPAIQVEVIIPKYSFIDLKKLNNVTMEVPEFKCLENNVLQTNTMWSARYENICLHLLEARHPAGYFHRDQIYGYPDDISRFIYFSRASLEYLKLRQEKITILHLHDWHVALSAVLAPILCSHLIQSSVLTIHNVEYQGKCAVWNLDSIGLEGAKYLSPDKLQDNDPQHPKLINLLKGGIVYADAVTTVSPTYAHEIMTKKYGYSLDATLSKYKNKVTGILNGMDLSLWNPGYSATSPLSTIIQAKESMQQHIARTFHLAEKKRPWVGAITRLAQQKGPHLLESALRTTVRLGGTFLLLGSAQDPEMQSYFTQLKEEFLNHPQVLLHFVYDEALAKKLFTALDFLVIPSLYEPCGLTQMIAMHYGTIPIARTTGGLKDTIVDAHSSAHQMPNGFLFTEFTNTALDQCLENAIRCFHTNQLLHQTLMQNGMRLNWSWEKPAQDYIQLYERLTIKTIEKTSRN